MAKTLSASIALAISGMFENTLDINAVQYPFSYKPSKQIANGSGAGQAGIVFSDTRTIAASSNDDLDLNGTALQDAFGANLALTKVKAILIVADATNTNDVVVGGAPANAAPIFSDVTDKVVIKPGDMFLLTNSSAAGFTITAGTGDLLRVANSGAGTSVSYTIFILGV